MLQNIKAVIFDLDGTLVDSMWIWHQIDIEYLSRFELSCPDDLSTAIEGLSFSETAVYFKERFSLSDSLDKIKNDWNEMAWNKYINEVQLKNGVYDFLCFCKEKGLKLGIATSNSRELVEGVINAHNLSSFFDCIMTSCDVNKGKPAPDIYLAVADKLDVLAENCLVFEDIIPGIQAGLNAGMKVCAVEDAYSASLRLEKEKLADYFIEDYRGIQYRES